MSLKQQEGSDPPVSSRGSNTEEGNQGGKHPSLGTLGLHAAQPDSASPEPTESRSSRETDPSVPSEPSPAEPL